MVAAASGARAATPPGRAWDLRPGVGDHREASVRARVRSSPRPV